MTTNPPPDDDLTLQPAPPQGPGLTYKTPAALDAAIKDRITAAAATSRHTIAELRRQFAYDRLLARLFTNEPNRWVLKGGTGLLARLPGEARHSQDIDLFYQGEAETAALVLQAAASTDLGDYFQFIIERASALTGLHPGHRYRATAYLGARQFATFGLDVVVETNMTGPPDRITNLTPIVVDGLPTAAYLAYPVADHIADKHAAMLSTYNQQASTRYRDLVDLVIIAGTQHVDAHALRAALLSEYAHRRLPVPSEVTLPSNDWIAGYEQAVKTAPNLTLTATDALALVGKMLNPVLAGRDNGTWNPSTTTWVT